MIIEPRGTAHFNFVLYVAGDAPNSSRAQSNLRALCEQRIPGRYAIDVVDVFQDPARALAEKIFMTPTLVRTFPLPQRRIVGALNQGGDVAHALGLDAAAT